MRMLSLSLPSVSPAPARRRPLGSLCRAGARLLWPEAVKHVPAGRCTGAQPNGAGPRAVWQTGADGGQRRGRVS